MGASIVLHEYTMALGVTTGEKLMLRNRTGAKGWD